MRFGEVRRTPSHQGFGYKSSRNLHPSGWRRIDSSVNLKNRHAGPRETNVSTDEKPGEARSPGVTYRELLEADTHPVPDVLWLDHNEFTGDEDISHERYTTREWHLKEKERVWGRVWQYACRTDEIAEVGDYYVYEICEWSFIVMRTAPDEIKAYPNACLHRGRKLKDYDGRCSEIRCAFHGFAWELDGDLKDVPAEVGLPPRRGRSVPASPSAHRRLGRLRVHQPRPQRRAPRGLPRRDRRAVRGVGSRASLQSRRMSPRSSRATGRSRKRRSARRTTSMPPTRRSWRTWATPTARSMCGTTSPG